MLLQTQHALLLSSTKQGDNQFGSVHRSVRFCLSELCCAAVVTTSEKIITSAYIDSLIYDNKDIIKLLFCLQNSLEKVAGAVNQMLRYQAGARQHIVTDWYVVNSNNTHIQRWSILMITVICGCGGLQVI